MRLSFVALMALLCVTCKKDEVTPIPSPPQGGGGTGVQTKATAWTVSELSKGGVFYISSAAPQYIYIEIRANGVYIADNNINECNGRFTTDNKSVINFDDKINCTEIAGDPSEYNLFKDVLTKEVASYTVNGDTTLMTLRANFNTFITLQRKK